MIHFDVFGLPESQGSMRAFVRGGRAHLTSSNRNLNQWRDLVAFTAQDHAEMLPGPVNLTLHFYLPRPKSLPKKVKHATKRPDIDKLCRAVLDALTGVCWKDDSQIVALYAHKKYETERRGPGVRVVAWTDGLES